MRYYIVPNKDVRRMLVKDAHKKTREVALTRTLIVMMW